MGGCIAVNDDSRRGHSRRAAASIGADRELHPRFRKAFMRFQSLVTVLCLLLFALPVVSQGASPDEGKSVNNVAHLSSFQVYEFRRYTIKPGEREHFAQYFEAWFPEAMQQLG